MIAVLKGINVGGGGSLVRIRAHAMTSIPVSKAALATAAVLNPFVFRRLLSMIGCMIDPIDDPDATMVIASARRCLK